MVAEEGEEAEEEEEGEEEQEEEEEGEGEAAEWSLAAWRGCPRPRAA